jgi:hypothetical protein
MVTTTTFTGIGEDEANEALWKVTTRRNRRPVVLLLWNISWNIKSTQ